MQNMNSLLVPAGLSPGNRSNDGSLPTLQFELAGGGCTRNSSEDTKTTRMARVPRLL